MNNKRGISPLIATVLLIGFAVALAAVVMTWGGGFIRSTTESTEAQAETTLMCATKLNFDVKIKTDCSGVIIDNKCNLKIKNILLKVDKGDTIETEEKFIENIDPYNIGENSLDLVGVKEVTAIATLDDGTICSEGRSTTVPSNCGTAVI